MSVCELLLANVYGLQKPSDRLTNCCDMSDFLICFRPNSTSYGNMKRSPADLNFRSAVWRKNLFSKFHELAARTLHAMLVCRQNVAIINSHHVLSLTHFNIFSVSRTCLLRSASTARKISRFVSPAPLCKRQLKPNSSIIKLASNELKFPAHCGAFILNLIYCSSWINCKKIFPGAFKLFSQTSSLSPKESFDKSHLKFVGDFKDRSRI